MGLRVKGETINSFTKRLRTMPRTVAQAVAQKAAPVMTGETRDAFNAARTVYDKPRPTGVDGPLTLEDSGAIKAALRFTSEGTRVRAVLGPKTKKGVQYGRFLIGRYDILPNGPLPIKWKEKLDALVKAAGDAALKGRG